MSYFARFYESLRNSMIPSRPARDRMLVEAIEPRILHSADISPLQMTDDAAEGVAEMRYLDGNGDLAPQMLDKVIVSPELEDTMRLISGTTLKVSTSLNDTNVVSGTPYEVWHWLDAYTIIYCGDGENGLEFHVRQNPSTYTWEDGNNPDIIRTRLRMQLGTGCKRPGKFIGQLTG